jgi:predicted DNA binding CopG/RHH family protein
MNRFKLTKEEKAIEDALIRGEYRPVSREENERIRQALARTAMEIRRRQKDAVLNIRINSRDLDAIKQKARNLGVPYQTLVAELLHQFAA